MLEWSSITALSLKIIESFLVHLNLVPVVSEVLESLGNHSNLLVDDGIAWSVDQTLDARKLVSQGETRDSYHFGLFISIAGLNALLSQVEWNWNKRELFAEVGWSLRLSGSGSSILTSVVDLSQVRLKKLHVKVVITSLVDLKLQNSAANLEKVSSQITLDVLNVLLLIQVRLDKQVILGVVQQIVKLTLMLLGRQLVA